MSVDRPYRDTHVSVARLRKVPRDYSKSPLCEGKNTDGPFYYKTGEHIGRCKKCGLPAAFIPVYKGSSNLQCVSCNALYLCTGHVNQEKDTTMSKGEYIIGVDFNPSGNADVDKIKAKAADLIDAILEMREQSIYTANEITQQSSNPSAQDAKNMLQREIFDLSDLAVRQVEQAAMLAVKAATKKPPKLK